jgi:hypothetical protein
VADVKHTSLAGQPLLLLRLLQNTVAVKQRWHMSLASWLLLLLLDVLQELLQPGCNTMPLQMAVTLAHAKHMSPARRPLLLLLLDVLQELPQLGQVLRARLQVLVVKALRKQRRHCCRRQLSQPPAGTDINHLRERKIENRQNVSIIPHGQLFDVWTAGAELQERPAAVWSNIARGMHQNRAACILTQP